MSAKGSNTTSDFCDFDRTLNKGFRILKHDKSYRIGFLIIVGINTGLRISDLLSLKHADFQSDCMVINERKTGKRREIDFNENIKEGYKLLHSRIGGEVQPSDYVFVSQKGSVYSVRSINRILKDLLPHKKGQNISSHSLRKTFGRRVFEINNESEKSLIILSQIFNHSTTSVSRRYLGIRGKEISNIYLNL